MSNFLKTLSKKQRLSAAILILLLAGAIIGLRLWANQSSSGFVESQTPSFAALEPADKTPNWRKAKPSGGGDSAVYLFTDTINGTRINVSQQPLPAGFRDDPATKVADLARSFNATKTMQVQGLLVYIGTSAKGPQSIIFSSGQILVLIKSDATIPDGAWADYIKNLKKAD